MPAGPNTGFSRKEFRGKLAIAITANFVNRNTTAEASVEEISGVAFIFNQKFFLDLKEETGQSLNLKLTCINLINTIGGQWAPIAKKLCRSSKQYAFRK